MINGIIVDIILFFIIAGNAVLGYKRGLVKVVFNMFSTVLAIILVLMLYKPILNYILNSTNINNKLENIIENNINNVFKKEYEDNSKETEKENPSFSILKVFVGDKIGNMVEDTVDVVAKSLSTEISYKIISIIVFFALFAIIRLLLYLLKTYMDAVANLPIINIFNGSCGMIYGILKGFLIIYGLFAIISIIMPIIGNNIIITSIENARIGSKMFNNNIILNFIFKFL